MFNKGQHKRMFAYSLQVACDGHGWILEYSVSPGNEHDSRSFHKLLEKLNRYKTGFYALDAGYKTSLLARTLEELGVQGVFPYTSPKGAKKASFRKNSFTYLRKTNQYLCPEGVVLDYKRINKDGYLVYNPKPSYCRACPSRKECLSEKSDFRTITRHLYEDSLDRANCFRLTDLGKELYKKRKETIERVFAEGKENHGLRFTRQVGIGMMELKAALSFTCMNMKKYARLMDRRHGLGAFSKSFMQLINKYIKNKEQKTLNWSFALYL